MAVAINSVWYVNFGNGSSTGYFAVAQWTAATSYTVGQIVRQRATPTANNERCFICIVAGTSHATTEPTWTVTKGAKNTDNTVTWQECTGLPALNADLTNTPLSSANRSGSQALGNLIQNNAGTFLFICTTAGSTGAGEPTYNTTTGSTTTDSGCTWTCIGAPGSFTTKWGAPHCKLYNATAWGVNFNAGASNQGDTIYVSSASVETQATSINMGGGFKMICVANAGSIPPTAADVTTGASVSTTGSNNIAIGTSGAEGYIQGINFTAGDAASNAALSISTSVIKLENLTLKTGGSGFLSSFTIGGDNSETELVNVPIVMSSGSSASVQFHGRVTWRDTASAISNIGTPGVANFATVNGPLTIIDCDLSGWTGGSASRLFSNNAGSVNSLVQLIRCKLPARTILISNQGTSNLLNLELTNCDNGSTIVTHEKWAGMGVLQSDTTVVRTGGATDGTTPHGWKIGTSVASGATSPMWASPFKSFLMSVWNTVTGADVTVTVEAAYNGAALPNNDDVWFDVLSYLGTAGSPVGTGKSGSKANFLSTPTAWTVSTQAWDSQATARANSTAYVIGDARKVSSNTGRIFICTAAGTSSGSLPGGYASAVDGGSVTDGGATFRAAMRCKMSVVLTGPQPQIAGPIFAQVKVAKVNPTTNGLPIVWVDPYLTLS